MKGKLRLSDSSSTNPIVVGDQVICEQEAGLDTWVINDRLERSNYIVRQSVHERSAKSIIASNVDQLCLIASMIDPCTSTGLIDRILVTAEAYHIPSILVFNKVDIYDRDLQEQYKLHEKNYVEIGYKTISLSAISGENIDKLTDLLSNKISLLSGQSGVGKSTIINRLLPGMDIKTRSVSSFSGKGVHTTSYSEMHKFGENGWIIDSPGFKEFALVDIDKNKLSHYFPEMKKLLLNCKYNDCQHVNEPGCAVKESVEQELISKSRYKSYLKMHDDFDGAHKSSKS